MATISLVETVQRVVAVAAATYFFNSLYISEYNCQVAITSLYIIPTSSIEEILLRTKINFQTLLDRMSSHIII